MVSTELADSASLPTLSGYTFQEEIYTAPKTAVYRAVQDESQRPVVIKVLKSTYPSFNELVHFRNQYAIVENLKLPGMIRFYGLEPYGNSYALIMEDWGAISLADYLATTSQNLKNGQGCPLIEALTIAIQLAEILHDLGQHQIVHKDIKPANILIRPDSKQVKLIDFSIASLLPKESQGIQNPHSLEGTLAYLAPEQTGRMNRCIDYRADFYSLGVTLYEMLTGVLPFPSEHPLELVHCHIAQTPVSPCQINLNIPPILASLVLKLMAKNAEDRYQSALGLKYDLEQCLYPWKETGTIPEFQLGQRDHSDRFLIPEKLYGREAEVQLLLESFDRVANGRSEIMLVAGSSGIGKTAVVNEVHKPITRQCGYFIKGKFDQFNRNVPLSAFLQALRDLISQLLSESDSQLAQWQTEILNAVGDNGQVLIEVFPELEQVIGPQPTAPTLSGTAAQNRFNRLFQQLIEVFTTAEHPLVIFLDDLQWADLASLQLIKLLMADQGHLLLLGAYRDNEVSPTHSLRLTLDALEKAAVTINTLTLNPLIGEETNQLVADALKCSGVRSQPLTDLIIQKTQGNPFFTTQFLKALYEDKLITFNHLQGCWECDIVPIKAHCLTTDVVVFMAQQLDKLPVPTQQVLKLAACIGNQFDLRTLKIILEQSESETVTALWPALQEGLILPTSQTYKFFQAEDRIDSPSDDVANPTYRFLHDRVQQAAYSLFSDDQKALIHYSIGRLLRSNLSVEEQTQRRFEIVNHLNQGLPLIKVSKEKADLLALNLLAGQQAHSSTAYEPALTYFLTALSLLEDNSWQTEYALTKTVYTNAANNAYLSGDLPQMEVLLETAFIHTQTLLEKVALYEIKIQSLVAQHHLQAAIQLGLEILQQLGIDFPQQPSPQDFGDGLKAINAGLSERSVQDLLALPEMTDPVALAGMQILLRLSAVLVIAAPHLMPFAFFKMVGLSIEKGNTALSALGYATYGMILCSAVGDIETGYQFGQLAKAVLTKFSGKAVQAKTMARLNAGVWHWKEALRSTLPNLIETYQVALETGDVEYAAISAQVYSNHLYFSGAALTQVDQELAAYSQAVGQLQHKAFLYCIKAYHQHTLNLLGQSADPLRLIGQAYDETVDLPQQYEANDAHGIAVVHLFKGMGCYLFEAYEVALENFDQVHPFLRAIAPFTTGCAVPFYDSLVRLAMLSKCPAERHSALLEQVAANQSKLESWAHHAPMNYLHRLHLVEAERLSAVGEKYAAMEWYDQAIRAAKENHYIHEEALANERAAKFYLAWGKDKVAEGYMLEAYYGYSRWGAQAKTQDLEQRYPDLLKPILQQSHQGLTPIETLATIATPNYSIHSSIAAQSFSRGQINTTLDFAAVLKASQSLASTMELDELLRQLTQIILQHSGGDLCALILPTPTNLWQISAIATPAGIDLDAGSLEETSKLPIKLIQYVKNTQEVLVIDDLNTELSILDEYLSQQQPRSILCLPILTQGKLIGILYLSNQSSSGVFTNEHILILNFICTQAAISLENARLYHLEKEKTHRLEQLNQHLSMTQFSVDHVADGILWINQDSSFFHANQAACQMLGYSPGELLRLTVSDIDPTFPKALWADHWQTIKEQKNLTLESQYQTQDGRCFPVEITISYLAFESHEYNFALVRDISERKQTETKIQEKNQALEQALTQLQQSQAQLVQSEKMSALGNLVAGVAHEINNPIGFLKGSLDNANDYLNDLFDHLELYQKYYPDAAAPIQESAEGIDLEFICEDMPKLLNSMKGATDRITNISTSLRTFSRADTEHKVNAQIHEGMESTLLILKYRLKANDSRPAIEIIRDYGQLPVIDCFPGQLNQVFMNILANAIDVFDEAAKQISFAVLQENPQKITIQTMLIDQETIEICIQDNGPGMSESVKAKIFDHLFTTKGVGKGTGLGLAIAKQIIVEKHGGQIAVASTPGQGTTFQIHIPTHIPN